MEYQVIYLHKPQDEALLQRTLQGKAEHGWTLKTTEIIVGRNKMMGKLGTPKQTMILIFERAKQ